MRVLWIITSHPQAQAQFEQALALSRTNAEYLVRTASNIRQVPEVHLSHSGVVFVLDAFNPAHPGFEGLKKLRGLGFGGHIFVAGEPSPETAEEAFKKYHLSGFFGSFDRIDYKLAGGVIHSCFNYKENLDLKVFLEEGGRSSEEEISNSKDFNHFVDTLGNFVSRFGISSAAVKKVLMGLSLGHMKMGPTGPTFEGKFTVQFGVDKKKLVLSLKGLSKGCLPDMILGEFTGAILALGSNQVPRASLFPDMHHVVRSARSLNIFSGNRDVADPAVDPMSLMTVISFPEPVEKSEISSQWFGYCHVKKSEEMAPEMASLALLELIDSEEMHPSEPGVTDELTGPRPIDELDLQKILADPAVVSGEPAINQAENKDETSASTEAFHEVQREPGVSENSVEELSTDSVSSAETAAPAVDNAKVAELSAELEEARKVLQTMGQDLNRLMKERREPTTDRELREVKTLLEEKNKKLALDKKRLEDAIALKDTEINELKARVEELRLRSAA